MKNAREVAWSYIADQNGRYIDADDFETQVVALTKIIEADRASRGTGEREAGRRGLLAHLRFSVVDKGMTVTRIDGNWLSSEDIKLVIDGLAAAPAEPPTGHLEVAVRALEEIKSRGLARTWWGKNRGGGEVVDWVHHPCGLHTAVGGDCDNPDCDVVIASRALAALRAAKETP